MTVLLVVTCQLERIVEPPGAAQKFDLGFREQKGNLTLGLEQPSEACAACASRTPRCHGQQTSHRIPQPRGKAKPSPFLQDKRP